MIGQLLYIAGVFFGVALVIALAILTFSIIFWSFHVSFLYGIVSVIGIEILPLLILILPFVYR